MRQKSGRKNNRRRMQSGTFGGRWVGSFPPRRRSASCWKGSGARRALLTAKVLEADMLILSSRKELGYALATIMTGAMFIRVALHLTYVRN
jgi:hypothetical protein